MRKPTGGLVYSTDGGTRCPGCQRPLAGCVCRGRSRSPSGGSVVVSKETKGRKGGGVTLVRGLPLSDADLAKLTTTLKSKFGVGGAVKDGVIELQGDQRAKVQNLLQAEGYTVKRAGG